MKTQVLICDDSGFARKQMIRALPEEWDIEVTQASDGSQALEAIREGKADVMFLDLTMPVMDGYGVLEVIRKEDLPCMVIVVSGDIQPEAMDRVKKLGALEFIKKPVNKETAREILTQFGILSG